MDDHFEAFVNRKNLDIADLNFAPEFADHGTNVPPPKTYAGGAYKKVPDIHVDILDVIAKDDHMIVCNQGSGTEAATRSKCEFSGIVS